MVDNVVVGDSTVTMGLDFVDYFRAAKPAVLAATEDDKYGDIKRKLCEETGSKYVVLPKTPPAFTPVSTSSILLKIRAPQTCPLRVDFAGGWLDVPRFSREEGGYIVNCAITPLVSLSSWPYELKGGLGGSGAYAVLQGGGKESAVDKELELGVGWQDPAVVEETGLCVWRSGERPRLDLKVDPAALLFGKMGILWTGADHDTPSTAQTPKDLDSIASAGAAARAAVLTSDFRRLCKAVDMSYGVQLGEGMEELPDIEGSKAKKYCGGGFGGYALYLFDSREKRDQVTLPGFKTVEPYMR